MCSIKRRVGPHLKGKEERKGWRRKREEKKSMDAVLGERTLGQSQIALRMLCTAAIYGGYGL